MTWKIGTAIFLMGIVLVIGSVALFGTSFSRATAEREVANLELEIGSQQRLREISVDPNLSVMVIATATLILPETIIDTAKDRGSILKFSIPVNYKVFDESGNEVDIGAGSLMGSTILPDKNSPHLDSFNRTVECTYRSHKFDPPKSGKLIIEMEISEEDSKNNPVTNARIQVHDSLYKAPGRWAVGGIVSLIFGGALTFIGFIVLFIGIILAVVGKSDKAKTSPQQPEEVSRQQR